MRMLAAPICSLAVLLAASRTAAVLPNVFTKAEGEAVKAFLGRNMRQTNAAIVVGLIDESDSQVFSAGTLDNGTERKPDGDSVFFIGSVSKTFTALLLLEMAHRGEVNVDDPVAKYLPASVTLPTHGGKKITLLHLPTHSAGLPVNPDTMNRNGTTLCCSTHYTTTLRTRLQGRSGAVPFLTLSRVLQCLSRMAEGCFPFMIPLL